MKLKGFCRFINNALAEELDKFPSSKDPNQETEFQLLYISFLPLQGTGAFC
jgi:DNA-directed RNA polymerase subunit beta